ncbi:hypothetical protein GWK47_051082 [Chionoecetes opilio]|uniref:Uncharacterized protein n=1 Tax=Chionoecetes opilio TaxID=41210 RepID=A0A8J4Y2A4_CHIOP|nr:hypothetical protein GWK47_051082 [Chionoecetes opilio]
MGDCPEGAGTTENGTRDGTAEGVEGGGTVAESVVAVSGEGSRPPSLEPGDTEPVLGLDLAGFKKIYIGKIVNPKQVCPLDYLREDRCVGDLSRALHAPLMAPVPCEVPYRCGK